MVRRGVASALGAMGASAKSAIPSLISSLKDSNIDVRWSAAEALGNMGESAKTAIPSLISLLKAESAEGRSEASATLKAALKKLGYKP
jgi:HEAT repeat protein